MISYSFSLTPKREPLRTRVDRLEEVMTNMPQAHCPVQHYFAPGLYGREITIPKGVTVVGAIHRRANLAILSKGSLTIATEDGAKTIHAPCTVQVLPGSKNAVTAHEEAVWTNFFATNETDTEKLVELLTESTADELLGGPKNKQFIQSGAMPCLSEQ